MIKSRCFLAGAFAFGISIMPIQAQTAWMNHPKTPFSVQVSASGSGISGVYRFNGPTQDGTYIGIYMDANTSSVYVDANTSSERTDISRTTLGG